MSELHVKNCPCCGTPILIRIEKKDDGSMTIILFDKCTWEGDTLYYDDGITKYHLPMFKKGDIA